MKQNASQSASGADLSDQMSVHIGNHLHFYLGCLLYPQDILNYKLTHGDTTLHCTIYACGLQRRTGMISAFRCLQVSCSSSRGGLLYVNIDSITVNVGIGIGSIPV